MSDVARHERAIVPRGRAPDIRLRVQVNLQRSMSMTMNKNLSNGAKIRSNYPTLSFVYWLDTTIEFELLGLMFFGSAWQRAAIPQNADPRGPVSRLPGSNVHGAEESATGPAPGLRATRSLQSLTFAGPGHDDGELGRR